MPISETFRRECRILIRFLQVLGFYPVMVRKKLYSSDDFETSNWISANTKECPKCHVTIEKNGGCNHIKRKNTACKEEFCWICLGPWAPLGSSWYNCNRCDDSAAVQARDAQAVSRAKLERYLFYYNRYANHLQSMGFEHKLYSQVKTSRRWTALLVSLILPGIYTAMCVWLLHFTTSHALTVMNEEGLWHLNTINALIGGSKPLQCILGLVFIGFANQTHVNLWNSLNKTERMFRNDAHIVILGSRYVKMVVVPSALLAVFVLCSRIVHFKMSNEKFGEYWFADASFVIIILLNIWQITPLLYFCAMTSLARKFLYRLSARLETTAAMTHTISGFPDILEPRAVDAEPSRAVRPFYLSFLSLTRSITAMDNVFNVFVLFSVVRCVAVICLTLYFLAETKQDLLGQQEFLLHTYWSMVDIVTAFVYLVAYAWNGSETNRLGRSVLSSVLQLPALSADDKHQVYLFSQKITYQMVWSITVWKAFPIERGFALTLCSGIMTYFGFIWKMRSQDTNPVCYCGGNVTCVPEYALSNDK